MTVWLLITTKNGDQSRQGFMAMAINTPRPTQMKLCIYLHAVVNCMNTYIASMFVKKSNCESDIDRVPFPTCILLLTTSPATDSRSRQVIGSESLVESLAF